MPVRFEFLGSPKPPAYNPACFPGIVVHAVANHIDTHTSETDMGWYLRSSPSWP